MSAANASTATATIGTVDLTGSGSPGTGGEPYCGRFAPSPTGDLHSGSLLTATGSYLAARSRHGRWLVRMEDIDRAREVPGAADRILRTLDCFGFEWDGLVVRQSDRLGLYEAESRHNLLLGPRNVKPYIERRGEAYMSKDQLDHFRSILSSWKRDLMEEVDRTVTHMKDEAANPPDPNDRATLESEFALELRTRDRERKLIRKIDEALKRIDDGSYGFCLETGEPIGVKRLEARPVATLCIEAQERRERRERQYGDRDDWYR